MRAIPGDHALGPDTVARLDALSDEGALQNALDDPDAQPATRRQLDGAEARRERKATGAGSKGKKIEIRTDS